MPVFERLFYAVRRFFHTHRYGAWLCWREPVVRSAHIGPRGPVTTTVVGAITYRARFCHCGHVQFSTCNATHSFTASPSKGRQAP